MARNIFGGTVDSAAEDATGARIPNAVGTAYDGPSAAANTITDLTDTQGAPLTQLVCGTNGMLPQFYGPDGFEVLWVDFGAGRVALTSVSVGDRFDAHLVANDPHGDRAYVDANYVSKAALNYVNVRDYGARGDGVTDDTAAIQAAINATTSTNLDPVFFPAGSYLLNSAGLTLSNPSVTLLGNGPEASKLVIGPAFTGTAAVTISAYNCQVVGLSINGQNQVTTNNPVADAIQIVGARRAKVDACDMWYVNGWAVNVMANTSATGNPDGTMLSQIIARSCAGGIRFLGNTASGFALNSFVSDIQIMQTGVTVGASSNLDGFRIEDAWDVLITNLFSWVSTGTGSSLHIKGRTAASFIKNLDTLGPSGAPCVLIEDGPNGSPQNVQLDGGVIQQGSVGLRVAGGAYQIHCNEMRFINNSSHAIQVDGTGKQINLRDLCISQSGTAATGTNYDLNWSGTATGTVTGCSFGSPIVATGTAGVQYSVNVAQGQTVRFINSTFEGTGAAAGNWFTALPSVVLETTNGVNFASGVSVTASAATSLGVTGQANGQRLFAASGKDSTSSVLAGGMTSDQYDRIRWTADGVIHLGSGTANRDTTLYRSGVGALQTDGTFTASNLGATTSYTPTISGGALTLGNGTMTASYSRIGSSTVVNVKIVCGSTTTLAAAGNLNFSLPAGLVHNGVDTTGTGYYIASGSSLYHAAATFLANGANNFTVFQVGASTNTFNWFDTNNGVSLVSGNIISATIIVQS
jgi:hypothetical protein